MITQLSYTKPDRYIVCPACNKDEKRVDHLPEGTKTAWYCDECGVRFRVHILPFGRVGCEVMPGEEKSPRVVTLKSTRPFTLQLNAFTLLPDDDEVGHASYHYNEHTCPTNFLGEVFRVIAEDGEEDPHGIFQFVKIEPVEKKS